jgi:hypothetical protein
MRLSLMGATKEHEVSRRHVDRFVFIHENSWQVAFNLMRPSLISPAFNLDKALSAMN